MDIQQRKLEIEKKFLELTETEARTTASLSGLREELLRLQGEFRLLNEMIKEEKPVEVIKETK